MESEILSSELVVPTMSCNDNMGVNIVENTPIYVIYSRERYVRNYLVEKYNEGMEKPTVYFDVFTGDLYKSSEGHSVHVLSKDVFPIYSVVDDEYLGYMFIYDGIKIFNESESC